MDTETPIVFDRQIEFIGDLDHLRDGQMKQKPLPAKTIV